MNKTKEELVMSEELEQEGVNTTELDVRMFINDMLIDQIDANTVEIEGLLKNAGRYHYKKKQSLVALRKRLYLFAEQMDKDLPENMTNELGDFGTFLNDLIDLSIRVPKEKYIFATSGLKLLIPAK